MANPKISPAISSTVSENMVQQNRIRISHLRAGFTPLDRAGMIRIPKRRIADALIWLLAAALLLWLGDWTVWRIRVWRGGGYDTVQVNQILLIPLKNHKMEADSQSTADQPCARSIFPHGGDDPCWWLRRHATVWQQASLIVPVHSSGLSAHRTRILRVDSSLVKQKLLMPKLRNIRRYKSIRL